MPPVETKLKILSDNRKASHNYELMERFEAGLAKYREQCWDEAIAEFQAVLAIKPGDAPAQLYLERCAALKECPPEGVWDGVCTMTRK